jgi:hypothetical protein
MEVRVKRAAMVVVLVSAVAVGACSKDSGKDSKATATTTSSAPTGATPTSAAAASGPVTDADVTDVDQIIHRLDSELDRLDSDMATGEGDVQ